MSQDWDFTLSLTVEQPEELLRAAMAHPHAEGMLRDEFLNDDGTIDIESCLVMLLDPGHLPGCDIIDSSAEVFELNEVDLGDER
jgi:hypothetical protein